MKIRFFKKISTANHTFAITSTINGSCSYSVSISNTPSCSCPYFKNNGARVNCKHIFFVMLFPLHVEEKNKVLTDQHVEDKGLISILSRTINSKNVAQKQT